MGGIGEGKESVRERERERVERVSAGTLWCLGHRTCLRAPGALKGPQTCSLSWVSVPPVSVCESSSLVSPALALKPPQLLTTSLTPSSYCVCTHMGLNPVIVEIKMISLAKGIIQCD